MAMFTSAQLALRRSVAAAPRAASLGEGLRQASDGCVTRRLLHGQLLPRCFSSDAFGLNRNFPPSGRDFAAEFKPHQNLQNFPPSGRDFAAEFKPHQNLQNFPPSGRDFAAELKPHQNLNDLNYVRQNLRSNTHFNFNNADNGGTMLRTAGGEKPSFLGGRFQHMFSEREQYSQKKRDFVHVLLKRNKTFVTVTDASGNKKTGASAGCLEDRKGRSRLSRYSAEATAEHVGRSARKMGIRSVVMKVKGISFFKKKKKVILGFREGFRGERVRDQSPIMYIHDVTQLPHNGCRLPKQRRI